MLRASGGRRTKPLSHEGLMEPDLQSRCAAQDGGQDGITQRRINPVEGSKSGEKSIVLAFSAIIVADMLRLVRSTRASNAPAAEQLTAVSGSVPHLAQYTALGGSAPHCGQDNALVETSLQSDFDSARIEALSSCWRCIENDWKAVSTLVNFPLNTRASASVD